MANWNRKKGTLQLLTLIGLCSVLYVIFTHRDYIHRSVKQILLVTYGRSGSTFTSFILKQPPTTFFFFEPLRSLLVRATRGTGIVMSYEAIGSTFKAVQELPLVNLSSYERNAISMLDNLFDCDISKFPVNDYLSTHLGCCCCVDVFGTGCMGKLGTSFSPKVVRGALRVNTSFGLLGRSHGNVSLVHKCLHSMVNDTYLNLSHYLQCLLDFWHDCHVAPLRLIKVIRLPLRAVFRLMRQNPDLLLVYLVRDPRATLTSQSALFGRAPTPRNFCQLVLDDVTHLKLLQETFPSRAVAVRYEDIANEPLNYTRRLYQALNLSLTSRVETNVRRMTSEPQRGRVSHYSVFRSDPREAASSWRRKISVRSVREVDGECGTVYEWLGYRTASSEAVLRNLSIPLTGRSDRVPFL